MTAPATRPRIAIIHTSPEVIDLLTTFFEQEGYEVASAHGRVLRPHPEDLEAFLAQQNPPVLLWDLAPPSEENWRSFEAIRQLPVRQGRWVVLPASNACQACAIAGLEDELVGIVGKPFDLPCLQEAVAHALAAE